MSSNIRICQNIQDYGGLKVMTRFVAWDIGVTVEFSL